MKLTDYKPQNILMYLYWLCKFHPEHIDNFLFVILDVFTHNWRQGQYLFKVADLRYPVYFAHKFYTVLPINFACFPHFIKIRI